MEIKKSTRHSKIAGAFGEGLLLYWLSKHGFECATVDHTGIDLIARSPFSSEVLGISVKSRTRISGTEYDPLHVPLDQFEKARKACEAFHCKPYFAIVADAGNVIRLFVVSLERFQELSGVGARVSSWKLTEAAIARYYADPTVKVVELHAKTLSWWTPGA
jgi:hypothetical protein